MWKIFNKLFGWDYINVKSSYLSIPDRIVRVHVDGEGHPYYWLYSSAERIYEGKDNIVWLTCHPGKYLYPNKTEGYTII